MLRKPTVVRTLLYAFHDEVILEQCALLFRRSRAERSKTTKDCVTKSEIAEIDFFGFF